MKPAYNSLIALVIFLRANLSGWYVLLALLFLSVLLSGCAKEEDVSPELKLEDTRGVVLGKWSISKIEYQLCRSNNCNASNYTGTAQDYFEFRADSAFLVRTDTQNKLCKDAFRIDYTLAGGFVLSNSEWSGRFMIKELDGKKLVLENAFTGTDPYAVFKDTYHLYR
ncbi:lipocalin family protein [Pontibacter ruber]|uniref:Lipocalin family protein n=1 Tax=Pontibacter ruber TaxID=1343895 RepID=A0ABW5CUW2_9BACT|nr:lipocalin family protein [Pontibacter ruber]